MTDIHQVQEFWDRQPCNVKYSDHPVGSREYFDQVEHRKLMVEPHILNFSEFSRWRGQDVLEIGCGLGTMAVNFARLGARYTGIELSSKTLDLCRQRFDVYGLSGKFYEGNAEDLDSFLPHKTYDLVYSWGVIHHTPNPTKVIDQIRRYVKPDGTVKIMVYATNSWKNYMIQAGLDQPEAQWGCPIANTYTQEGLIDLLGPDFEIEDIVQDHIFPYEIEAYKRKEYVLQPWFQNMPKQMFRVLESNLGWHLMVTARKLS